MITTPDVCDHDRDTCSECIDTCRVCGETHASADGSALREHVSTAHTLNHDSDCRHCGRPMGH